MKNHIYLRYALLGLGLTAVIFLFLTFTTTWWWYFNWLIATSVITFLFYGFDKMQAIREKGRMPNMILHLMALIGGFLGAFVGRAVFHHKSNFRRNPQFLIMIILGFLLSMAIIIWHYFPLFGNEI